MGTLSTAKKICCPRSLIRTHGVSSSGRHADSSIGTASCRKIDKCVLEFGRQKISYIIYTHIYIVISLVLTYWDIQAQSAKDFSLLGLPVR